MVRRAEHDERTFKSKQSGEATTPPEQLDS